MNKLKLIRMIWKLMWWRRFNNLRQIKIDIKNSNKRIKTLRIYEYIIENPNIFKSIIDMNDDIINKDIKQLDEEVCDIYKGNYLKL